MRPIYTVGHSNRSLEDFLGLLSGAGVEQVVDVRRLRGSARFPQFDADPLAESLRGAGIGLSASPELAGRRPRERGVDATVNGWWVNRSFHNYADHALTAEFADALAGLRGSAAGVSVAVMCSEAVWWRCHRRIIADHLLASGVPVLHLLGQGRSEEARLSDGAVVGPGGSVTYPSDPDRGDGQ